MAIPTYRELLSRMLDRVPNNIDKREGSLIYDAIAPAALELADAYIQMEEYFRLAFVASSEDEYLTSLCSQFGVDRLQATYSLRKAEFKDTNGAPFDVDIGERFTVEDMYYSVESKLADGEFAVRCEEPGAVGNRYTGRMIPVDYVPGLGWANLLEVIEPAEDTETDEALKIRFYEYMKEPAFGGNVYDYKRKTKEIEGVGQVRVIPVWNGPGTVKVLLLDSELNIPNSELVQSVQEKLDPLSERGQGIAPIGHTVTVVAPNTDVINVSLKVTATRDVESEVANCIKEFFLELTENWEQEELIARISYLESRILNLQSVVDVENLQFNGVHGNHQVPLNEVPIMGVVTFE